MPTLFCCDAIQPYRPMRLEHEQKFTDFMKWATDPNTPEQQSSIDKSNPPKYSVQLVGQVNYGPVEFKKWFALVDGEPRSYEAVSERDMIEANFQKLNTYKNFKCTVHNKFFEVNIYQVDPVNKHHWRTNIARPGSEIDL